MVTDLLTRFAASVDCSNLRPDFFGFPTWYEYLKLEYNSATGRCEIPSLASFGVQELSLIALAIVDILLRVAALVAVGYVVYGGVQFITAQGEADQAKKARQTAINALIGLTIALISTGLVAFVGSRIG